MLTGILAPMPEEIELIIESMEGYETITSGQRTFYIGLFAGKKCVVALSRIGKVASGVTAAVMIEKFGIDQLIVCGVAGGLDENVRTGDIVIATECVQHDADCRPLFPQFEAPLLGKGFFECDENLILLAQKSCNHFINNELYNHISKEDIDTFQLNEPTIHLGQLCCGDQFIGSTAQLNKIRTDLPQSICVEMEGGAVGQVCYEYGIPYIVIRTISDNANDEAHIDFNKYISNVAKYYTHGVITKLVEML